MSVLIKGIDKPKNSRECPFAVMAEDWGKECIVGGEYHWDNERVCEGCPLVEVSPHGRLIDADKLLKKGIFLSDWSAQKWVSEVDIGLMRTIIEAEEGLDDNA